MRLNGWHRVWVVSIIIWLCAVMMFTWFLRPKPEQVSHSEELLAATKPQSAIFRCPTGASQEECEKQSKVVVEMPNGYHFLLAIDDKTDGPSAVKSYWQAVEAEAMRQQKQAFLWALVIWFIPAIVVLLLGHSVAWVRRGFTTAK